MTILSEIPISANAAHVLGAIRATVVRALSPASPANDDGDAAAGAPASMTQALSRYEAARDALNGSHDLPMEQEDALAEVYSDCLTTVEHTTPATALDFVRKFAAVFDEGMCSTQPTREQMLREARALIAAEAPREG